MKRLAASGFGLGWLPLAPGSWGSLPPAIIFAVMSYLGASSAMIIIVMIVLAVAGSVICVKCAPASIAATGDTDPNEVVADEIAGQAITFALAGSFVSGPIWWAPALGGFFLFRLFDVIKPCPARRLEKLPQGWGILADDLFAGLYAAITLVLCLKLWASWSGGQAHPQAALGAATRQLWTLPSPSPALYDQVQGLRLPLPSQSTAGGPTPCRRRLNIHRQCPEIGMQKPAYPTDSMLRGGDGRA